MSERKRKETGGMKDYGIKEDRREERKRERQRDRETERERERETK